METVGIKGKKCEEYITFLEEISNAKVKNVEHTHEYFEEDTNYIQEADLNQND